MDRSYSATRYARASGKQLCRLNHAISKVHIEPKGTTFAGKCQIGEKEYEKKMKAIIEKYDCLSW